MEIFLNLEFLCEIHLPETVIECLNLLNGIIYKRENCVAFAAAAFCLVISPWYNFGNLLPFGMNKTQLCTLCYVPAWEEKTE